MNSEITAELRIYSDFGDDPDMFDLVELFVEDLPERVTQIQTAHANGDTEVFRRTTHQLKGAAGGYGFQQVTDVAAVLEAAIREDASADRIDAALEDLVEICARVCPGAPE